MSGAPGTTQLDDGLIDLGRATTRKQLVRSGIALMGASFLASLGIQTFAPTRALGASGCTWCGPSPACPSSCCWNGYCISSSSAGCTGPTNYTWDVCSGCNIRYRCRDCYQSSSSTGVCWCVTSVGGCTGCPAC